MATDQDGKRCQALHPRDGRRLGRVPRAIPATQAQDGDLMLINLDGLTLTGGTAVAVCSGRHAITQDHTGATFYVTRDRAIRAWALEGTCPP
jgi:hypothetical protein